MIMSKTSLKIRGGAVKPRPSIRRLKPSCEMPRADVLSRLTEPQRARIEQLLASPLECVYHPSFRSATPPTPDTPTAGPHLVQHHEGSDTDGVLAPSKPHVLSAEDEQGLFLRFNYCRNRVMRVMRKRGSAPLTAADVREILHWDDLALMARAEIVGFNTSLVLAMARRYRGTGAELMELIGEGNLALLRCVDKFDASRGFKFSTYACRAILASFSRAGAKAARQRSRFPTSYDPTMERSDFLEARRAEFESECVDELKRVLTDNSAELSSVERHVLSARFRLGNENNDTSTKRKTLDQVGSQLGVSKERVRQIQNQAMTKLRAVLEERLLIAS